MTKNEMIVTNIYISTDKEIMQLYFECFGNELIC